MKKGIVLILAVLLACCFVSASFAETAEATVLCDTFYFNMIKSTVTAESLVNGGDEAIMAGLLFLEVDRHYTMNPKSSALGMMNTPILNVMEDDPVYAGLDQSNNGIAAYPCLGGSYYVYSWQGKKIIELGKYPKEEIQDIVGTWKVCKEIVFSYFEGTIEGLKDALGR